MRWYVVQAKDIEIAQFNLGLQKYETYRPIIEVRGKTGVRQVSMFGNYLFIKFDMLKNGWQNIGYTRGVRRIMCMQDEEPCKVPKGFVEGLKEREEEGKFKLLSDEPLKIGESLRILEGPLTGVEGVCSFSTNKRVGILLHLLNRETRVYLSNSSVVRI